MSSSIPKQLELLILNKQKEAELELEKLQLAEKDIYKELDNFLLQKTHLDSKIKGLTKIVPTLKVIKSEAENLVKSVNEISNSSENISSKIRSLDKARNNVNEVQQRVSDLIDLELCSEGVQKAILNEDYEQGAAHVHRFLAIDQSLLQRTASDIENVTGVLKSVRTLQDAAGQLSAIIKHKFDDAVKSQDLSSIERFLKIFPLLGLHNEGIEEFCQYLCTKLEDVANKNLQTSLNTPITDKRFNVIYADMLTLLFEGLARIIDSQLTPIETYFGPGHLLHAVRILQNECDRQSRLILLEFNKMRQINKKLNLINEITKNNNTNATNSSFNKMERIDPKELYTLIVELTVMHARAELYFKFIKRKISADIEVGINSTEEKNVKLLALDNLIKNSQLSQTKHELMGYYLRLEQYYMEETVAKAISMDAVEQGQQISSMVDDTFFIVRNCIRRAISSSSVDGICAIINNACRVLESDYCYVLKNRLKQGYPSGYLDLTQAYNVLQNSLQQGRLQPPGDAEQTRTAFIIALNNTDNSNEYVEALCENVLQEIEMGLTNLTVKDREKLESCLSGLSSVTATIKEIIDYGMQQLRVSAVKPRIGPWVDGFLNINHSFTEEELSAYDAGEPFIQTLIINLDTLLSSFKDILTTTNFDALITVITTEVVARLEKVILKTAFNRLGGLVLDKEIRALAGYLTTSTSYSIRDKFARLTQIATILNLEKVTEISDYWGSQDGTLTWRLTPTEIRSIMSLRLDFKIDDIKRLKL